MREIKFRAWYKKEKRFIELELLENGSWCLEEDELDHSQIEKWLQYTGLKDENGKEIYEGDILNDLSIVEYMTNLTWDSGGSPHPGFYFKGYSELEYGSGFDDVEVIGNIYENPELLNY